MGEGMPVRVVVSDRAPVNAATHETNGQVVLVLSPHQSRDSAIMAVAEVLPHLSHDQIVALVDEHLPELTNFDMTVVAGKDPVAEAADRLLERAQAEEAELPPLPRRDLWRARWKLWRRPVAVTLTTLVAVAAAVGAVFAFSKADDGTHPFERPRIAALLEKLRLECHPVGDTSAWCVDNSGRVYAGAFASGMGIREWTLSSGYEWVELSFHSTENAAKETLERTKDFTNPAILQRIELGIEGRWVFSGTASTAVESIAKAFKSDPWLRGD